MEKGFVKGFIDFIFEYEGRVYFADWKSDQLLTYQGHDFRHYIEDHYLLQAQLYTLGVVRWLKSIMNTIIISVLAAYSIFSYVLSLKSTKKEASTSPDQVGKKSANMNYNLV